MSYSWDNDYCPNCGKTNCSASCYYAEREYDGDDAYNSSGNYDVLGVYFAILSFALLFVVSVVQVGIVESIKRLFYLTVSLLVLVILISVLMLAVLGIIELYRKIT